jgi:hypothetical protein
VSKIDPKARASAGQMTDAGVTSLLEAPLAANMMVGEMASQITQEIVDFTARRMRAQMEFVSSLPVGDVKGMMEAQFRFFEQASRDYADEFGQVAEVVRKATTTAVNVKA